MSSAIPKACFSIGVEAPAAIALLQSPSENDQRPSSRFEILISQVGCENVLVFKLE